MDILPELAIRASLRSTDSDERLYLRIDVRAIMTAVQVFGVKNLANPAAKRFLTHKCERFQLLNDHRYIGWRALLAADDQNCSTCQHLLGFRGISGVFYADRRANLAVWGLMIPNCQIILDLRHISRPFLVDSSFDLAILKTKQTIANKYRSFVGNSINQTCKLTKERKNRAMYEDFKAIFEQLLAEVTKKIQIDKQLIAQSPDGRMMFGVSCKKKDVFRVVGRGKARIRTVISKDSEMQMLLAKKALLKNEIDKLTQVRSVVLGALEKMDQIQDMDSLRFLIANYPWLPDETVRQIVRGNCKNHGWEDEPYEQSDHMPEHRTMMTSRGLLVRSKSELLIAEALYRHGISFRYEQVLWIDGRTRLVPDFTIMKADGSIVYWEHRGRMDLRDYAGRQLRKDELYASVGIVPWKNLIVTYDTEDGDIDLRVIESEIRNKLL